MPGLENITEDQLDAMREKAIFAYAKAQAIWNQMTEEEKAAHEKEAKEKED